MHRLEIHNTVCTYSIGSSETAIAILDSPRLHRQRKSRRRVVEVLCHDELARRFDVAPAELKAALIAAGWDFHEDANGHLWAVPQDSR